MWIQRDIRETLRDSMASRPCVMLTGARQTGKSSLLERLFSDYNYVSLDSPLLAQEAKKN